jgi:hypothetical protein
MSITTKTPAVKTNKTYRPATPQLRVQSGLRAGGAQGSCDVAYWRSELNYWRNLAEQMGCA